MEICMSGEGLLLIEGTGNKIVESFFSKTEDKLKVFASRK
jgi:hypothetical protein